MKLTREGKRFLLASALIAVAAYNTGNNLIYLILAMMLSILSISAAALLLNVRGLALSVRLGGPVFAGQDADLEASITNRKRSMPSYSLRVILPEGLRGEGPVAAHVEASSTVKAECAVSFERRGVYRWGDFKVESGFPFIFLTRRIGAPVEGAVTVYPRLMDVKDLKAYSGEGQPAHATRPGRGEDLLGIREFRSGDDARLISWKASAKARGLMVREMAEDEPRAVNIILDDFSKPFDAEAFERAVSCAASLAVKFVEEGLYVGLVTSAKSLPYGSGPEQLYKVLDVLAVAREAEAPLKDFVADGMGASILVKKSPASRMTGALEADMVVYASEL